jgi:hypothetical protein
MRFIQSFKAYALLACLFCAPVANAWVTSPSHKADPHTLLYVDPSSVVEYNDFSPHPSPLYDAPTVVDTCMTSLLQKRGLDVCFEFSSDRCRAALGGSLERFREYAKNPVFGFLVQCTDYKVLSIGPIIQGTPTRGSMQTVLMEAIDQGKEGRKFLWTLQQERRPPRQGCWVIHEVIYVKNAFALTL